MGALASLAPVPRSARTYVGRTGELARVGEWLDREILFMIYGVGGIGKSELVYKAIEAALGSERWRGATTVLVRARPGMTAVNVLARLRFGLGSKPSVSDLGQTGARPSTFEDQLVEAARLLDARPALVLLDDIHHLDPTEAARLLGHLSRHVRESRIFAASRVEVPLPPDAPTPVIIQLSPLSAEATAAMVAQLAAKLGLAEAPDPREVFRLSGGSPFFVQRLLAGEAGRSLSPRSTIDDTVAELPRTSRGLLLSLALSRGRFAVDELAAAAADDPDLTGAEAVLRELARRFLVDISREEIMVHDLVRDALFRLADDEAMSRAHHSASRLHQHRFRCDERNSLDAVEAINHLLDAGDIDAAWTVTETSYPAIAGAGFDHLLLDALARFSDLSGDQRLTARDLIWARTAIRQSLIQDAAEHLERVAERGHDSSYRYALLLGEVARRRGDLMRAEELFSEARELAKSPVERFHSALQLADVRTLRGHNAQARAVLEAALGQYETASPRDRGRWGWSLSLSYGLDENFATTARVCRETAEPLCESGADDLVLLLTTLEALARAECNDIATANALLASVAAMTREPAAPSGGAPGQSGPSILRQHVLELYTGVVQYAEGRVRPARANLQESYTYFLDHADYLMSRIAGYYLVQTMLAERDVRSATELIETLYDAAARSQLRTFAPSSKATFAEVLLATGRLDEAQALATEVFHIQPTRYHAMWSARTVLLRIAALRGDLEAARAEHRKAVAFANEIGSDAYLLAAELEGASIELMGGDPNRAVAAASAAWRGYAACGRLWLEARSAVALAAALVSRGTATDLVAMEAPLSRAEILSAEHGYPHVVARAALVRAALLGRQDNEGAARKHLVAAVRDLEAYVDRPEIAAIRAALAGPDDGDIPPGERAVVAALGFVGGVRYRIVEGGQNRVISQEQAVEARVSHDLVVEPARATITADKGAQATQGRPMTCQLLARLIEGQGAVVTAEELFRDVWGAREYHPLRNRNTVYVAVKRLRQALRKLLGEREVVETASGGWRIADSVDAVSIRPVG